MFDDLNVDDLDCGAGGVDVDLWAAAAAVEMENGGDFGLSACSSPCSSPSYGAGASSSDFGRVFGSFLVDKDSSTPYTDATQVRDLTQLTEILRYCLNLLKFKGFCLHIVNSSSC